MTSKKHRNFVSEPMGRRPVTDVPGIGNVTGERFRSAGYDQAKKVLGQYLVMDRNEQKFTKWMQKTSSTRQSDATKCYNSLDEWSNNFL